MYWLVMIYIRKTSRQQVRVAARCCALLRVAARCCALLRVAARCCALLRVAALVFHPLEFR
jgi:hypothetical protein